MGVEKTFTQDIWTEQEYLEAIESLYEELERRLSEISHEKRIIR
ncbi:hypothetical protein BTN49_0192 [Candidatus Enterovibrio escicola]|uniref:Uncharacterized protein n=1 Tax=Candidatus Enterovibrio escicola TaxID=1927127 RepID=A0A2A5T7P6_9GAMM|nr:hypothetical protein BTN49_0192 [Candidatus Enterovibrio escacola]